MKRLLNSLLPTPGNPVILDPEESNHALRVLRLADSARILVLDGCGREIEAVLRVEGRKTWLDFVRETRHETSDSLPEITLEVSILKGDAMSWVVEKAVELGAHRLVPVETDHGVVRIKEKGPGLFRERWQRIADQSLKQCGRLRSLQVSEPIRLEELLRSDPADRENPRYSFDESLASRSKKDSFASLLKENKRTFDKIRLLVGPEGGWSESERGMLRAETAHGLICAHLGPYILRAESASLAALTLAVSLS